MKKLNNLFKNISLAKAYIILGSIYVMYIMFFYQGD